MQGTEWYAGVDLHFFWDEEIAGPEILGFVGALFLPQR